MLRFDGQIQATRHRAYHVAANNQKCHESQMGRKRHAAMSATPFPVALIGRSDGMTSRPVIFSMTRQFSNSQGFTMTASLRVAKNDNSATGKSYRK
ncbi:hypothetical protein [Massilia sp. CCM 8734]|uniref:hypothetical protein n=1 Tax=Massilia sp. CCM 8734 TaxID=2609283 RepID=UPI0014210797|nr:hypothetical protein [Massilia sp. CCM 8734]NHZ96944.1 hypothetical protein [Massilia sp. CCM 8734]